MKKYNYGYMIGIPLVLVMLVILGVTVKGLAMCMLVGLVGFILFFLINGVIYKITLRKMSKQLEGMEISQVFSGANSRMAIDTENNKIVLTFAWNPLKIYTMQLSNITSAKTCDYKSGSGIFEGTMRVAFIFEIDGIKVVINTFIAQGQKFGMDSNEVLTGIAKADAMVEILTSHLENKNGITR